MSNPFFKKIAELLFNFFQLELKSSGERYYLQLDHSDDVEGLLDALRAHPNVKQFVYQHELGQAYKTFSIDFNDVHLVIAATSDAVKPDFLVTLRNQVGEQKGVWEKTALLSIVSSQLDSIQGGSSDLQKEGMPLHAQSIVVQLKKEIENSLLSKVDQIILLDRMELTLQEQIYQQITFFDFEEIFKILSTGSIHAEDYKMLGLFKDDELATFKGNKLKERLELNRGLFGFVKNIHDFGIDSDELDKRFTSKISKELEKENWAEVPFLDVLKSYQEQTNKGKGTKVELKEIKSTEKLEIWNKPVKETSAGERKRHIIIFNPDQLDSVQITASFLLEGEDAKSLNQSSVVDSKNDHVSAKAGKNTLHIEIQGTSNACVFAKVGYKHNKKPALGAELNIAVLPIESSLLNSYRSAYLIVPTENFITLQYEGNKVIFGEGTDGETIEVIKDRQEIPIPKEGRFIVQPVPEAFSDDETLSLNLVSQVGTKVPIKLINELPESTPITGMRIWKLKRENQKSFEWINNRLMLGNREFYVHGDNKQFFEWESRWIEDGYKAATYESGNLVRIDLELDEDLREAYSRFINQFNAINNIPSLTYYAGELANRAKEYVEAYIQIIQSFKENKEAGYRGRDLFKLGVIKANNVIYLTPFHPLLVAYQLQLNNRLKNEEVESSILNRLRPDALLPFIFEDGQEERLYKPEPQTKVMEWMIYKPVNQVSVSDANRYLAKVIEDKLFQFEEHFGYLFAEGSHAPLKINLIHIENDLEVLRGIFHWMLKTIEKRGLEHLKNIELTLYKEKRTLSAFDEFSRIVSVEDFEDKFLITLSSKQYDGQDLLRIIRTKLNYYKQVEAYEYRYAHISFYKMQAQERDALQPMNEMLSGIALEGLYSFVPAMKSEENYRSGFGIKGYQIETDSLLMNTAYFLNELAANLKNGGSNVYHKAEAIYSRTTTADEKTLEKIFGASYWVTFIDSNIDLEFFNNYKNLVVIHYSDQYSTTSKYDAITVTDKFQQYYSVIRDVLNEKNVEADYASVQNTVKAFNTFNGEWLLRIIGSKGHYAREKLSIISAIKFSLAYFDHPNLLWVPISLEEILRVAGAVSLNKSEGIFTAKNLGVNGSHSDDLLLVGLEYSHDKLKMHFYPIEVKIGLNNSAVINKAKLQVKKTKSVILDALTNDSHPFTSKFYRYFFAQLFITNAQKLQQSDFWPEKAGYRLSIKIVEKLLKDNFEIAYEVNQYIGEGAVLSFEREAYLRSSSIEEAVTYLSLTEDDGYSGLTISMESMRTWIQMRDNDFIKERMLSSLYHIQPNELDVITTAVNPLNVPTHDLIYTLKETAASNNDSLEFAMSAEKNHVDEHDQFEEEPHVQAASNLVIEGVAEIENKADIDEALNSKLTSDSAGGVPLEEVRVLIGKAENSEREIYWEYGNGDLANRHLLISGKSGQGKTYLIQCLLLELSKKGISSIIVDYTEGFLPNQLEPEFVQYLGPKLVQRIVYNEKFPMNPFRKNVREIGGITIPEDNTDIAERVKSIFASVYKSLGIQQLNAIYDAVLRGLEQHGVQFSLPLLKEALELDGSSYAKTALSQIRPFIDRNPFLDTDPVNWGDVLDGNGNIYIIQLTAYPRDVQLILTEFVLWDLWNYSVRNGDKTKPIPLVLDEAQNLDHSESSPSTKILTEGRKFGWSGWFATQFLKAQLGNDELARLQNSSQKLYFAQPEQESAYVAGNLANEQNDKKKMDQKIANLKKGQCIFNGPILKEDGTLSSPIVQVVNISPLKARL